jgi:hypothetical protein
MTGFSSSLSMGMDVEWTHVDVQRCLRRTYEFCGTSESARLVSVVGSSSNSEARSFECGTDTRWYTGPLPRSKKMTTFCCPYLLSKNLIKVQ